MEATETRGSSSGTEGSYDVTTSVMRLERFAAAVQEAVQASPRSALARRIREELSHLHGDVPAHSAAA